MIAVAEAGLTASNVCIDSDNKIVHKTIVNLPDFHEGLNGLPDKSDYERLIGDSISIIKNPAWGLNEMIPSSTAFVVENREVSSGYEGRIDMEYIDGSPLSKIPITELVADQLTHFLKGCTKMAQTTKEKNHGEVYIPDLLGGIQHPKNRFTNFIVENSTGKLYFVDLYPLAKFQRHNLLIRNNYRNHLREAALATNHKNIVEAASDLSRIL